MLARQFLFSSSLNNVTRCRNGPGTRASTGNSAANQGRRIPYPTPLGQVDSAYVASVRATIGLPGGRDAGVAVIEMALYRHIPYGSGSSWASVITPKYARPSHRAYE